MATCITMGRSLRLRISKRLSIVSGIIRARLIITLKDIAVAELDELITRSGKHRIRKVSDLEFRIEADHAKAMNVPVTIYANDSLISKMVTDRTLDQAGNVATLPGIRRHVVVLPDGHEGYGFPVGGVAATDFEEGVISPGGVGYDINCGVRLIRTNLTEGDARPRLKDLVNELFSSIPSGVGSKGTIKLTNSELDELLVEGVGWAVRRGYGMEDDIEVCEEDGNMAGADPASVSDTARKRGIPQLRKSGLWQPLPRSTKGGQDLGRGSGQGNGVKPNRPDNSAYSLRLSAVLATRFVLIICEYLSRLCENII